MTKEDLSKGWIDVSLPVESGMVHWPGDPDVNLSRVMELRNGDNCNVTKIEMCAHTGTHMDAPIHFLADGAGMESAPLEVLLGAARVIQIDNPVAIRRDDLQRHDIQPGERIIIRSQNSAIPRAAEFKMDFVYIAADAAQYLAEKGIALLGVDYMSVGGFYHDMVETHKILLTAGIWIVENVDLRDIEPGHYEVICLPLKLVGADGSPARVLLRR